jgi:spermidine/putrescine transport system permease protein/putrescine transport system permease protein
MRELPRRAGALLAALVLVAGAVAVLSLLLGLLGGELSARRLVAGAVGAALVVAACRLVPVARLLGGYSALVYVVLFLPIVVVVVYAFNGGRNVAIWEGFSTRWFGAALEDESITSAIGRSLRIAAASAVVATTFGTAAALALSRARPRLRVPFDVLVFLTLVVPELVIAISALIFFVNAGFELGLVTMFLAHTTFNASLVLLVVRARFASMGSTLEEASMDLGAGPWATLRQVTLPQLAPAIVAGGLLSFTFSFDDVVISQFTAGAGNDTWPLRILNSLRFVLRPDLNAAAAMMLALTLLALVLAALVLRASSARAREAGALRAAADGAPTATPLARGA